MKPSCISITKLLEKYFDRELTNEEKTLVESHLLDCQNCKDALAMMGKVRDLVRSPVEETIQEGEFQWVWTKIKRNVEQKERSSWRERLRSWLDISPLFKKRVWIPAVTVVAILLIITAQLFFKKELPSPGPSVVEYVESQFYDVMVYEPEKAKVTVIWLFERPEKMESPAS
jgi:hypothetical protein